MKNSKEHSKSQKTKDSFTSQNEVTSIKGLVLVGGKSTRMGNDKSELDYFGKPQKEIAKNLLEACGLQTFYSVSYSKSTTKETDEIVDKFDNIGPLGGICSAFQKDENIAWLVLATDLPFVDRNLIQLLLKKRNPNKLATTLKGKNKNFIEPLITIYEPKIYSILLKSLNQKIRSPLKILNNNDIEIVEVEDTYLRNINTPQEFKEAQKELDGN